MKIKNFEEIEAWQLDRELTRKVYCLTKGKLFSQDFGLKKQIQCAAGSVMHNIAEGYHSESTVDFIRFLHYAKRSCSEVQSELYIALDQNYISQDQFKDVYEHARRTRAATRGFINYLTNFKVKQHHSTVNREP